MTVSQVRLLVAALILGLALAAPVTQAQAGTLFQVTTTVDTTDANPGDAICDDGSGQCSLRAAVMETNALPGADNISLPAGTYALSIAGAGENAATTGDLDITGDVLLEGQGASVTVIDGQELDRVLHIAAPSADVTITHLSVRSGKLADLEAGEPLETAAGGGIQNSGRLNVTDVSVDANHAYDGGGIFNTGELTITRSSIEDNTAYAHGGIDVWEGSLSVVDSTISGNSGVGAGGIRTFSNVTLVNTTVSGNTSSPGLTVQGDAPVTIVNSTFVSNGFWNVFRSTTSEATVQVRNSIIADSSGGDCNVALASEGHNLDSDGTCGLTGPGDLSNTNPRLGPLGDNGGSTTTHLPGAGSPAIDGGTNDGCPVTDQRGESRPQDGDGDGEALCDIGAVEAVGVAPGGRLWGDFDCSGAITIGDAQKIARDLIGIEITQAPCPAPRGEVSVDGSPRLWGDLDCMSGVTIGDAQKTARYLIGLAVTQAEGCPAPGQTVTVGG